MLHKHLRGLGLLLCAGSAQWALGALGALAQQPDVAAPCPAQMDIGKPYTVQLEANLSTGYRWQLLPPADVLQVQELAPEALYHDGRVGAPVLQTWQLLAKQAVDTDLVWQYVRPWQTDAIAQTATCHIHASR